MAGEQFTMLFEEFLSKLDSNPGSYLDVLEKIANKPGASNESMEVFKGLRDSFGSIRLFLKYLNFDLEVTRRERDALRTILEDEEP